MPDTELIIALDVPTMEAEREILEKLKGLPVHYKLGPALFTGAGPACVELAGKYGRGVFLDLKLHDIPNTVKSAVEQAARLGVFSLSVHASGGPGMLRAAAAVPGRPKLWGITVLTSFDEASFARVGFRAGAAETVDSLAALARECGLDGVVCSPNEAARLRAALGPGAEIITPGIRRAAPGAGGRADDQKRTTTPREAAAAGADYIVVGRPVLGAPDPAAEAAAILEEIS